MERTIMGIEEKRNEALEVIKEGVLERSLLHEEIEESLKQRTKDEKEEENEEKRKKQRRKKRRALSLSLSLCTIGVSFRLCMISTIDRVSGS